MSDKDRDRLAADVEEYIRRGGRVQRIPPGVVTERSREERLRDAVVSKRDKSK
ncbi:MAG: hypothetical protein OXE50_14835 [Chloroflexi bacterium]|nr:hypothetical protein [Chloroflexota bacterium]